MELYVPPTLLTHSLGAKWAFFKSWNNRSQLNVLKRLPSGQRSAHGVHTPGRLMSAEVTQASLAIQVRLVTLCKSSSVMRGLRSTSDEKTTMILAVESAIVLTIRLMVSGELTYSSHIEKRNPFTALHWSKQCVNIKYLYTVVLTLGRISEKEMQTPASSTCALKSLMPYLP